jgi:DNA-3-methyladenine glycosylase II
MTVMTAQSVTLHAVPPFDFGKSLAFLCGFPATAGEQRVGDGELVKALRVAGRTVVARITAAPGGVRAGLHARGGPLNQDELSAVGDRISFYLSLDDDLGEFYAAARQDAAFAPVAEELYGYHQVKFPSPLENLVWAILSQRNTRTVATRSKRALMDAFEENRLVVGGETYTAFPDLDQMGELSPGRLADLIQNERKADHVFRAVQGLRAVEEDFLRSGPYDRVREFLLGLTGVGPWSADFIMIRGLGRTQRVVAEKALLAAASRCYGHPVDERTLRRLAGAYGEYEGYWGHYLRAAS